MICRGRAHINLTRQALNMRPDVHLPVGTPPPQRRSHLVLGCAHLVAVAGGVTSQLTQIWPLASGLAGLSVGSSEIATVRRGWPTFVNTWLLLPLLAVLGHRKVDLSGKRR